jgi:dGTPase
MVDHGGFNHNHQSFRIVTQLEKRYPEFDGLNLTWEVLEGIVKHETEYDVSDTEGFDPELRGHLEAQIANVADELAYTAHDLDDGLRSGMITPEQLAGVSLWEVINESIGRRRSDVLDDLARHRLIRRLIGIEVNDLIQSIDRMIRRSGVRNVLELQQLPYNVVGFSEDMHRRNRELKDFLYNNLYNHYRVVRMSVKAERILESLFNTYIAEPTVLPDQYQAAIDTDGLHETVCDYIAGMTDRFATDEYQKLFDPLTLP